MQDIEFTVQEGRFYMLQTRSGKRTGRASVRIAVEMVREGMIDEQEALLRVSPEHVQSFLHPMVDPDGGARGRRHGAAGEPRRRDGVAVFSADEAVEQSKLTGKRVILMRRETTPEDIHGMRVAEGILTELGGMTSHAAVVARGMGVCAITGCGCAARDTCGGHGHRRGWHGDPPRRRVTLDGATGEVMLGDVPKVEASTSGDFQTLLVLGRQVPAPEGARQRRNTRGCRQGAGTRCRGHRPVPHGAHVLRQPSASTTCAP
jgi:pyruvate,orthophosphate dikinase